MGIMIFFFGVKMTRLYNRQTPPNPRKGITNHLWRHSRPSVRKAETTQSSEGDYDIQVGRLDRLDWIGQKPPNPRKGITTHVDAVPRGNARHGRNHPILGRGLRRLRWWRVAVFTHGRAETTQSSEGDYDRVFLTSQGIVV